MEKHQKIQGIDRLTGHCERQRGNLSTKKSKERPEE